MSSQAPATTQQTSTSTTWSIWLFLVPMFAGGVVAGILGPPQDWGDKVGPTVAGIAAVVAATYLALSTWKDDLVGAEALITLTDIVERTVPPFALGATYLSVALAVADDDLKHAPLAVLPLVVVGLGLGVGAVVHRRRNP